MSQERAWQKEEMALERRLMHGRQVVAPVIKDLAGDGAADIPEQAKLGQVPIAAVSVDRAFCEDLRLLGLK